MGSRSGKNKQEKFDPNFGPYDDPYYPGPSGYPPFGGPGYPPYGGPGYPPYGGPGYGPYEADPYGMYGYGGGFSETFESYGPPPYGGRFGRGSPGMSPWNYGNYYMGNTTMQMMPYMQRKVAKFAQRQGMGSMGGFGGFPSMPMMPVMPMMPMMAAATPLPMACNPIVQNMYPMVPMNYQYPSNLGMVMNIPYGLPNPLLTPSTFGGFSPQWFGGAMSCCCYYCMPTAAPPPVCYYPRPVSVPQPVPVPYPAPVPIPNIQQVPVPRPVTVVAPPIVAGCTPAGAPLAASYGGLSQSGFGQQLVMNSKDTSTVDSLLTSAASEKPKTETSSNNPRRTRARKLAASLSNLGLEDTIPRKSSKRQHDRHHRSKKNSDIFTTRRSITCPSDVCIKNL